MSAQFVQFALFVAVSQEKGGPGTTGPHKIFKQRLVAPEIMGMVVRQKAHTLSLNPEAQRSEVRLKLRGRSGKSCLWSAINGRRLSINRRSSLADHRRLLVFSLIKLLPTPSALCKYFYVQKNLTSHQRLG